MGLNYSASEDEETTKDDTNVVHNLELDHVSIKSINTCTNKEKENVIPS